MLRAAGIFLILLGGTGLGFCKSREMSGRQKGLREFIQAAAYLKGAVRCGNTPLPDAFEETAGKLTGIQKAFFQQVARELRCYDSRMPGEIFRGCAEKELKKAGFSEQERDLIASLGGRLGYLDKDMQLRQLDLFAEELLHMTELLERELPEKKKLCQSLGILGGILLGILLW